jgi:hypothetical protein
LSLVLGLALELIERVLKQSPLAQARGGVRGGCRGTSGSVTWSGLIGAANVSLPRYLKPLSVFSRQFAERVLGTDDGKLRTASEG